MKQPAATLLVVDDNREVLHLLEILLSGHGYRARTASSGEEALALLEAGPASILAALVDVQMPNLDGPATVRCLQAVRPGLPCVFMTGEAGHHALEDLRRASGRPVLLKPFRLDDVLDAVRALAGPLQAPSRPGPDGVGPGGR
jgi:CheY-like chemotaxis protein